VGLELYAEKLEELGVRSLEELKDPELVTDQDLIEDVGMSKIECRKLRKALRRETVQTKEDGSGNQNTGESSLPSTAKREVQESQKDSNRGLNVGGLVEEDSDEVVFLEGKETTTGTRREGGGTEMEAPSYSESQPPSHSQHDSDNNLVDEGGGGGGSNRNNPKLGTGLTTKKTREPTKKTKEQHRSHTIGTPGRRLIKAHKKATQASLELLKVGMDLNNASVDFQVANQDRSEIRRYYVESLQAALLEEGSIVESLRMEIMRFYEDELVSRQDQESKERQGGTNHMIDDTVSTPEDNGRKSSREGSGIGSEEEEPRFHDEGWG